MMEYRANNIFGGTFAFCSSSAFLLTTAIMLRVFAGEMDRATFAAGWVLGVLCGARAKIYLPAVLGSVVHQHTESFLPDSGA